MAKKKIAPTRYIDEFDFEPGRVLMRKYEVIAKLGSGWEGEVFLLRECATGIERAAKFFFPHRNPDNKILRLHAKKLHKLRQCPIVIQYHTQDTVVYRSMPITFLVSDYVDGELLSEYLARQPGKRLDHFKALHLLYALTTGIACIHHLREYHGDLHPENIFVRERGIGFEIELFDLFHWGPTRPENIHDDVCDLVRILFDAIGGQRHYARQPDAVKGIICGLKRSLILRKYRTAGRLKEYLEQLPWD